MDSFRSIDARATAVIERCMRRAGVRTAIARNMAWRRKCALLVVGGGLAGVAAYIAFCI